MRAAIGGYKGATEPAPPGAGSDDDEETDRAGCQRRGIDEAAALLAGAAGWHEKVFTSHLDFVAIAAAGPSGLPGLIARGRDLFISKGNLSEMPDFADDDPSNLLLGQFNGKFAEAGDLADLDGKRIRRGALIDDFNLDGKLDKMQINRRGNVVLFRNLGARNDGGDPLPMGNWSEIRLVQPNPNPDAVGAHIAIKTGTKTQTRNVQVGGGDASGHMGWVHVGFGTAERAEIQVQWPDGEWSLSYRVFANQFVVVDRTKAQAEYWYPVR